MFRDSMRHNPRDIHNHFRDAVMGLSDATSVLIHAVNAYYEYAVIVCLIDSDTASDVRRKMLVSIREDLCTTIVQRVQHLAEIELHLAHVNHKQEFPDNV